MKKQKKLSALIVLLCTMLVVSFLSFPSVEAAGKMSKKNLYLVRGQSYKLKVKGVSGRVKWKSGNPYVATVTSKGKVKAHKVGVAIISAKVGKKTYTCKVRVSKKYTNEKIFSMIKKYYKAKGYTIPNNLIIEVDKKTTTKVTIHVYTIQNDGPNSGHTATWNWFDINVKTGKGQDTILYQDIDFSKYAN